MLDLLECEKTSNGRRNRSRRLKKYKWGMWKNSEENIEVGVKSPQMSTVVPTEVGKMDQCTAKRMTSEVKRRFGDGARNGSHMVYMAHRVTRKN